MDATLLGDRWRRVVRSYLLALLLAAAPALGAEPSARAPLPAAVQAELLYLEVNPRGYAIRNYRGWTVTAEDAAWVLGDEQTAAVAGQVRRRHRNVGALLVTAGPILLIGGAVQSGEGGWQNSRYLENTGFISLIAGTLATTAGLAMLLDTRPVRPSTYYSLEQAESLIDAYNDGVLEAWGIPTTSVDRPRRRLPAPVVGVAVLPRGAVLSVAGAF